MTQSLCEVKQSAAESILKVKQKLGLVKRDGGHRRRSSARKQSEEKSVAATEAMVKAEGIKALQDENAELNKIVR